MAGHTSYLIPAQTVRVQQEIKRSRFIATVGRATNRKMAMGFIAGVRADYPDANHHGWAFVAGSPHGAPEIGTGDDGEPQGTAGRPMLRVLQYRRIGEIVAVVSRYFGGIKLGTGGLVRAYSGSVQLALEELPLVEIVPGLNETPGHIFISLIIQDFIPGLMIDKCILSIHISILTF